MAIHPAIPAILNRLRKARETANMTADQLDRELLLGPGWVARFESGQTLPTLDTLLEFARATGTPVGELLDGLPDIEDERERGLRRSVWAEAASGGITVHFPYNKFDAVHRIAHATVADFDSVIGTMSKKLSSLAGSTPNEDRLDDKAVKSTAVVRAFQRAVSVWPTESPSDIWWFLIYRAFCDPYNHPAEFARLSFDQSWKRTSGWALEQIFVEHYSPALQAFGLDLRIATGQEKARLIGQLRTDDRLETDKADILLVGPGERCFGVVHVKASFAERRTDDLPMSQSLIRGGYCSPLLTMDAKSTPGPNPVNRGELGMFTPEHGSKRTAKRKDIEDDGYFSACFSYNPATQPTPEGALTKARVFTCDFSHPDDSFTKFIVEFWRQFTV